ncbi:hypothetical protein V6Z11_A06G186200 [Gossypium hirsutum]
MESSPPSQPWLTTCFFLHKQFLSIVACLHSAILACNNTTHIELPHVAELTPLTDSHLCILSSTGVFISSHFAKLAALTSC